MTPVRVGGAKAVTERPIARVYLSKNNGVAAAIRFDVAAKLTTPSFPRAAFIRKPDC